MKINWKKVTGAAALAVLTVSSAILVQSALRYAQGKAEYRALSEETRKMFATDIQTGGLKGAEGESYLFSKNTDYIAWMQIDGTEISYPVVRERKDGYYLTHTFSGEENPFGTIFMDGNCGLLQGGNTILYGHNMKDGSMFGTLKKYRKPEYLTEHSLIRMSVAGKEHTFRIFACVLAEDGNSLAYTCFFGSMEEKLDFIDRMKQESLVSTEYVPQPEDEFLTLSTCTGPGGRDRLLILAAMPLNDM